ncbi:MJ1477/TM1410 family putative glycoside hydrolase [Prosthecobacter sp.]|uniref:MJ1477/TM1410 family putative glycoside hydrolase n=1 Tax=Prosthecobacter sp. TaxID=1965333 RepID=UPI0024870975|nr:MJ1477/TM1410 family putative glycoside hydrolase [Prosthecobacter sp.]MDI1311711.1 endo alpha-1,4 polygalactosaminidase [Prosthecobacter sp.]
MKHLATCLLLLSVSLTHAAAEPAFAPKSMAYVLQADKLASSRADAVQKLASCDRDLIVVDAAFSSDGDWTPAEIETIRAGKKGRRVVAYVSIGEAEDYRPYWKKSWDADQNGKPDAAAPKFLNAENPDWKGNYRVRYWQPEWQQIMLPAVDKVVAQAFDGIYLDIVDAFEFYEYDAATQGWLDDRPNPETGKTYRQDMINWVTTIAQRARASRPGFLVIPQNATQLLAHADYRELISAIGVEDLFVADKKLRTEKQSRYVLNFLAQLKPGSKPVLVIDYPKSAAIHAAAFEAAAQQGFTLLLTDRQLTKLGESK